MGKIFFLFFLLFVSLFSKENYSEMSNQELIAIMGYVNESNKVQYLKELNNRLSTMSEKERLMYEKNKEKLKK